MPDNEFMGLMAGLGMYQRRKVVKSLLAGNDTQCFTTEQYLDRYVKLCNSGDDRTMTGLGPHRLSLAEKHLRSLPLVEVQPGVWTPANRLTEEPCPNQHPSPN